MRGDRASRPGAPGGPGGTGRSILDAIMSKTARTTQQGADAGQRKGGACSNCRLAKVKCDMAFPCIRCYKACLPCRPQYMQAAAGGGVGKGNSNGSSGSGSGSGSGGRKRTLQQISGAGAGAAEDAGTAPPAVAAPVLPDAASSSSSLIPRESDVGPVEALPVPGEAADHPGGEAAEAAAEDEEEDPANDDPLVGGGGSGSSAPLIDLVLARADPKALAEPYIQAFHEVLARGKIRRERVVKVIKMWYQMSLICGSDVTWGLASAMGRAFEVTPMEIEGRDALMLDVPESVRPAKAQEVVVRMRAATRQLQTSETFKRFDDGFTPTYMVALREDGSFCMASNQAFDRLLKGAMELNDDIIRHRTTPSLLFAPMIAHDDRAAWMRSNVECNFVSHADDPSQAPGTNSHQSNFVKLFDRDGEVRLHIVTVDRVEDEGGYTMICVHRVEPAPPSRHLSARPESHLVIQAFRQVRPFEESVRKNRALLDYHHPDSNPAGEGGGDSSGTTSSSSSRASSVDENHGEHTHGAGVGNAPCQLPHMCAMPIPIPASGGAAGDPSNSSSGTNDADGSGGAGTTSTSGGPTQPQPQPAAVGGGERALLAKAEGLFFPPTHPDDFGGAGARELAKRRASALLRCQAEEAALAAAQGRPILEHAPSPSHHHQTGQGHARSSPPPVAGPEGGKGKGGSSPPKRGKKQQQQQHHHHHHHSAAGAGPHAARGAHYPPPPMPPPPHYYGAAGHHPPYPYMHAPPPPPPPPPPAPLGPNATYEQQRQHNQAYCLALAHAHAHAQHQQAQKQHHQQHQQPAFPPYPYHHYPPPAPASPYVPPAQGPPLPPPAPLPKPVQPLPQQQQPSQPQQPHAPPAAAATATATAPAPQQPPSPPQPAQQSPPAPPQAPQAPPAPVPAPAPAIMQAAAGGKPAGADHQGLAWALLSLKATPVVGEKEKGN